MTRKYEQLAQSLNSDEAIIEAIAQCADESRSIEAIWESPTSEERLSVWERVTKNGLRPSTDYLWGDDPDWAPREQTRARTQSEITQEIENEIPAELLEKYTHLSYGDMAELPEFEEFSSLLKRAERDWFSAPDA